MRVGILGTGGIAARHAEAIAEVEGAELVASTNRTFEKAQPFSARHGGVAYPTLDHMLGEADLDLVVVALPPGAHDGQVERIAAAGVNLLVEKPISLDLGKARAMVAATGQVTAACGFMYRFGGAVERWQALAAAGNTGRTGHFSGSFHSNALHAPWWRSRELGGGQMVEQLIHIVDLARNEMGMPSSVVARATNFRHADVAGYDSEDLSAMIFGYDDGRIAVLHASNMAIPGRWMKGWQLVAEKATGIFADWNTAEIVRTDGEVLSEKVTANTNPFVAQITDLRDAIAERRPPRVPLADGLATLQMVLAAQRAADEKREVPL
jgi:predicted dehydrogenase